MWLLLFASVFSAIIIHSHCAIESDFVVLNSDAWFTSHLLCMPLCHSIHLNAFVLFRNVYSKYEFHTQIPWMVITNIHAHAHSHSHSLSIESDGLLTWTSKITEHILAIGIFVDNISFNLWWFYPHRWLISEFSVIRMTYEWTQKMFPWEYLSAEIQSHKIVIQWIEKGKITEILETFGNWIIKLSNCRANTLLCMWAGTDHFPAMRNIFKVVFSWEETNVKRFIYVFNSWHLHFCLSFRWVTFWFYTFLQNVNHTKCVILTLFPKGKITQKE